MVIFAFSLRKIETFGMAVLLSGGNAALNKIIFDLRLISFLVAVITSLKIAYSIMKYRET